MSEIRCYACGALVPNIRGPVHAYMHAAPGCWALYASLEDWKVAEVTDLDTSMHLVDCYAAQHAVNADRRNRQSVAGHLMSLCAGLEQGRSGAWRRRTIGAWTRRQYPVLEPQPSGFTVTIRQVVDAPEPDRPGVVLAMAEATWAAWSAHHHQVRAWLASAADSPATRRR